MEGIVFGRVPYPTVTDTWDGDSLHLPLSNPYVEAGAPDVPDMIYWHRMIGTLWGTNGHFWGGNAATAYGVGVVSIDGPDDSGRIIEWIGRGSGLYGESSGPASGPYGDGRKFVDEVGVYNVNRRSRAIEISGNYNTPLDDPARVAIVAITAYWADQRKIPWTVFPIVPGTDGRSFIGWHNEITGLAYKLCPGFVVMNETPALIARIKLVLKGYQTVGKPVPAPTPIYAPSVLPPWWEDKLGESHPSHGDVEDVRWWALRTNVVVVSKGGTVRRSRPDSRLISRVKPSGPKAQQDEKLFVERLLTGSDGKKYYATVDGHFILASQCSPNVTFTSRRKVE